MNLIKFNLNFLQETFFCKTKKSKQRRFFEIIDFQLRYHCNKVDCNIIAKFLD